jgi:hypothetical protein
MLIASETRSPDVDMNDVICLEARNQKRNYPSLCLINTFQIDANHLNAQRNFKTPVNSCRKTLHKGKCLNGTFLKYPEISMAFNSGMPIALSIGKRKINNN